MKNYLFSCFLACFLLAGCASTPGASGTGAPTFTVAVEGEGNEVATQAGDQSAIIDVRSPTGIGRASVEPGSGKLPEKIVARLRLAGLEEFRLSYDETVITASVSSDDHRAVTQMVITPGEGERPISPDSPYWMDIQFFLDPASPTAGTPASGYFEITFPPDLQHAGAGFSFQWIDFYR